ncbi:MAG: (E)-4-hydroxy-3-methylbut-2-enyl-diphosphate synthase [Solitalea-like symbiont of Acarus siro]
MYSIIEKPTIQHFLTKEVKIGEIPLGSNNPIRIQSMTTTDTMDTEGSIRQCVSLINAGCDYIRLTAPSINEANNLINIKKRLRQLGHNIPLIADIHYTPNAAEAAARIVEKVRINPGNYTNNKLKKKEYTKYDHEQEQELITQKLKPLISICKQYGTALRIGVNHGSLSDRILNTYGNTPLGMVSSAMEFINACRYYNYNEIVISMKSSNVSVMIQAYKLLASTMLNNNFNYPLHLGLTEAGNGEDGRIKSAAAIGYLLAEGIGDTIRVSLTESPEKEVSPAKTLANLYGKEKVIKQIKDFNNEFITTNLEAKETKNINLMGYPIVISNHQPDTDTMQAADYRLEESQNAVADHKNNLYHLYKKNNIKINFTDIKYVDLKSSINDKEQTFCIVGIKASINLKEELIIKDFITKSEYPVIIKIIPDKFYDKDEFLISASVTASRLFLNCNISGIWLHSDTNDNYTSSAFAILQALGKRKIKAEYIACPGCGRTLFNLESITKEIQIKTLHLKNLKIGVMGCIVNGPGEMAGSDYGYVGAGKDKIHLYRGYEIAEKNIPSAQAVDKLIELIKKDGKWTNS